MAIRVYSDFLIYYVVISLNLWKKCYIQIMSSILWPQAFYQTLAIKASIDMVFFSFIRQVDRLFWLVYRQQMVKFTILDDLVAGSSLQLPRKIASRY